MATVLHPEVPRPRRNSSGLARDLEILELLASGQSLREGGLGVLRIAELTGRDKGAISRAMATLAESGLVARDPATMAYRLGPGLYALAARTSEATLVQRARPLLRRLTQAVRETTHLCVLRGGNVLTLMSELSPHEVATMGWAGTTTAAWRTPSGRVLLSDWDRPSVEAWYAQHGQAPALLDPPDLGHPSQFSLLLEPPPHKVVVRDLETLHEELERIRHRGFALLDEELEEGVVGASAPVRDATGAVVAAVNISAPRVRIAARLPELGALVARWAGALTVELGGPARVATR